eukprot:682998-Hanusia_phi.AAC.4
MSCERLKPLNRVQVDPRWKPYIGGLTWNELESRLSKKQTPSKKAKTKAGKRAKVSSIFSLMRDSMAMQGKGNGAPSKDEAKSSKFHSPTRKPRKSHSSSVSESRRAENSRSFSADVAPSTAIVKVSTQARTRLLRPSPARYPAERRTCHPIKVSRASLSHMSINSPSSPQTW